jgi:aurora kinase, other
MHSELYHNNIISLYCAWKDAHFIYVAVEWAPNGDVFSVMKSWGQHGVSEAVVVTSV